MGDTVAHDIDTEYISDDVRLRRVSPFKQMLLNDAVLKGLNEAGFIYPTNIQAAAIPLGKSGLDLLIQSKSGTGKTLIFCTILLEAYRSNYREPQSLIIAPCREIVVQIESVLNQIGRFCPGFKAVHVIGGQNVIDDRKRLQEAKAIIGTPGRLMHLIRNDVLNTARMKLLVLDEADKLYTKPFRLELQLIRNALPSSFQVIACSATLLDGLDIELAKTMRNPLLISTEKRATFLIGIKQFVYEMPEHKANIHEMYAKLDAVKSIFRRVTFKQCLIFTRSQSRASSYYNYLEQDGWPCEVIYGSQKQENRLQVLCNLRDFKARIVITTDLMARGIDCEHVDLVINLELPVDRVTYLHRIGRAGRFGSRGIAITFLASKADRDLFQSFITHAGGSNMVVSKFNEISQSESDHDIWNFACSPNDCEAISDNSMMAPLASQDNDSFTYTQKKETMLINVMDAKINENSSSIDTKTFQVKSTGIDGYSLEANSSQANCYLGQKLTPDSRQSSSHGFPSSNTIDDASSIVADSMLSSQRNISRLRCASSGNKHSLMLFLVDQTTNTRKEKCVATKSDLFSDYRNAVLKKNGEANFSDTESSMPSPNSSVARSEIKSKVNSLETIARVHCEKQTNGDVNELQVQCPLSVSSDNGAAPDDSEKSKFIVSVSPKSTPLGSENCEEGLLPDTSHNVVSANTMSDSQQAVDGKHFPSPMNSQGLYIASNLKDKKRLTVCIGTQISINPDAECMYPEEGDFAQSEYALERPSNRGSDATIFSNQIESPHFIDSNAARITSSGFDERTSVTSTFDIEFSAEETAHKDDETSAASSDYEEEEQQQQQQHYFNGSESGSDSDDYTTSGSDIIEGYAEDDGSQSPVEDIDQEEGFEATTNDEGYDAWVRLYWSQLSFLQKHVQFNIAMRKYQKQKQKKL